MTSRPLGTRSDPGAARRALVVLTDLPHPPRSGNHLRYLQTLKLVDALGYDVHAVAGVHGDADGRSLGDVGRLHRALPIAGLETTARARLRRLGRIARGGTGPTQPGPWALPYADAGLGDAVREAVDELRPQAVVLRSTLAHLAGVVRGRVHKLVFDVHDVDAMQAKTLLSLARPHEWPGRAARLVAARRLDRLLALGDEAWVPAAREADYLRRVAPGLHVLVVPSGVSIPPTPPPWRRREPELLLIAGLTYPPNEAAAVRLVERVLPLVQRRFPAARVTLTGRGLDPGLASAWRELAVTWLGEVEDLAPIYGRPAIVVLPYEATTETGTPLKVVEAIANGVPVVATPNATEALELVSGEHVLAAETDGALAAAVCRLLDDDAFARQLAHEAHGFARERFDPDQIAERLRPVSRLTTPAGAALAAPR